MAIASAVLAFLELCLYGYALWTDLDEAAAFIEICMIVAAMLAVTGTAPCPWLWVLVSLAGVFVAANRKAVSDCIPRKEKRKHN